MELRDIRARKIVNSRGAWALELDVCLDGSWFTASVPSGKSRGKHEAKQIPADDSLKKLSAFKRKLLGKKFGDQAELDSLLVKISGDKKKRFGVDLPLATSLAFFRAHSAPSGELPVPMFNVINGGLHAGSELAVQEFMIVPEKPDRFSGKVEVALQVYVELRDILERKFGNPAINVGDEGGFAPPLKTTVEALTLLEEAAGSAGMSKISLALDCAASSYYRGGKYHIDGRDMNRWEYVDHLKRITKSFHLFSVEDPLHEEDFEGFAKFLEQSKTMVVGDDLTATDVKLVRKARHEESINAVLVKPNQAGTVTEALRVIDFCRDAGWKWIISHRSGETNDAAIADLAVVTGSPFIKTGAPCRGERTAKYNRLLRLEGRI